VEPKGGAQILADVFAHGRRIDVIAVDRVQRPTGLFGALGGVRGQVTGHLAPLLGVERAHVEL
jgi:hypothetical protein